MGIVAQVAESLTHELRFRFLVEPECMGGKRPSERSLNYSVRPIGPVQQHMCVAAQMPEYREIRVASICPCCIQIVDVVQQR